MFKNIQNSNKVVGLKQVRRSIEDHTAKKVYLAKDVAPDIYDKIVDLCNSNGVEIEIVDSMKQLGNACKIDVPAAVAAIIG